MDLNVCMNIASNQMETEKGDYTQYNYYCQDNNEYYYIMNYS